MAAAMDVRTRELLQNELIKCYKTDLVEILLDKSIPDKVVSVETRQFLQDLFALSEKRKCTCECDGSTNIDTGSSESLSETEHNLMKELNSQMMKRLVEQELLIQLLREKVKLEESDRKTVQNHKSREYEKTAQKSENHKHKNAVAVSDQQQKSRMVTEDKERERATVASSTGRLTAGAIDGSRKSSGVTYCEGKNDKTCDVGRQTDKQQWMREDVNHRNESHVYDVNRTLTSSEQWVKIESRRNRKRRGSQAIVGNADHTADGNAIETVPRISSLYISRIKPGTTGEQMEKFIQQYFAEAKCVPLESKYPDQYAAFRVALHDSNMEAALNPEKWPRGALVNRFFQRKRWSANKP